MITCEITGKQMLLEEAHSLLVVLQKVTSKDYWYCQCVDEQKPRTLRYQHWYCDKTTLQSGVRACLSEHFTEEMLHGIPVGRGYTDLPEIVFETSRICQGCQKPITLAAYRFCLTYATPVNSFVHNHADDEGWCCSLMCAITHATQRITTL